MMAHLLFLLSFFSIVFSSPSSYTPGSYIGLFGSYDDLSIALWDASTGNNFTTVIAPFVDASSFIINTKERVVAIATTQRNNLEGGSIILISYQPRTAPSISFSCTTSMSLNTSSPFYYQGQTYIISGVSLYLLDTSHSGACNIKTIMQDLPVSFDGFASFSFADDHITYSGYNEIVDLWYSNGMFTKAVQHALPAGIWEYRYFQEDVTTSTVYLVEELCCNGTQFTMWEGIRNNMALNWTQINWPASLFAGPFSIDSRYEGNTGPMLCSTENDVVPKCWNTEGNIAWQGPMLHDAFSPVQGTFYGPRYDPSCN